MVRAVILAVGAVGLITGCVLYCVNPRFRHWADDWSHTTDGATR
jgi:hypothetical protein